MSSPGGGGGKKGRERGRARRDDDEHTKVSAIKTEGVDCSLSFSLPIRLLYRPTIARSHAHA